MTENRQDIPMALGGDAPDPWTQTSDDWQVVMEGPDPNHPTPFREAVDRLREREAQLEREARRAEALTFAVNTGAGDVSRGRAEAAEAREKDLQREYDANYRLWRKAEARANEYAVHANLAEARVAELEEALLSIKVSPPNNAQTLIDIARTALAHEEEKA